MKVVAFMQPKGSTAKSTTVAAVAHVLAEQGKRVLVVDLDPQADVTGWLGGSRDTAGITQAIKVVVANDPALWPGVPADEIHRDMRRQLGRAIQHTASGVDLIAADLATHRMVESWRDLRDSDTDLLLAELLTPLAEGYDAALLDCKGDMGVLSHAALHAATDIVGVACPTLKALEGLATLAAEVSKIDGLEMRAVAPVVIRPRNRSADADDRYQEMREAWPTVHPARGVASLDIPAALAEPITMHDPSSDLSADYRAMVADLQERGIL